MDPRFTRTAAHGDGVRAAPPRDGHPGDVGHALAHLPERLGGQGLHPTSASTAWRRSARRSRSTTRRRWSASRACRASSCKRVAEKFAKEKPATLIWCMGADAEDGRHRERARLLHPASRHRQRRRAGHRRQHLPRPHQRAGRDGPRPRYHDAAPLLRPRSRAPGSTGPRVWDVEYEWLQSRFDEVPEKAGRKARSRKDNMETPGITSTRWFDAVLLPEEQVDQRSTVKAMMVFGHGGNTVTRMPDAIKGLEKLDLVVIADPHPTSYASMSERHGEHLPAADRDQLRGRGLAHRLQPLAAMGRAGREADLRVEVRLRGDVPAGQEARLRGPDVQEHQGRGQRARRRGHLARDQPRRLVDRLLRPVAGAPQGAYEEPGRSSTSSRCAPRRTTRRSAATTTACPGRAGASRSCAIPARTSSTTPTST